MNAIRITLDVTLFLVIAVCAWAVFADKWRASKKRLADLIEDAETDAFLLSISEPWSDAFTKRSCAVTKAHEMSGARPPAPPSWRD